MKFLGSHGEELLTELWNKVHNPPYDFDVIDRLCTEDVVLSNPNCEVVGRAAFKEWAHDFSSKIQDKRLKKLEMFSSADSSRVVSRLVVTGYNQGVLGSPPWIIALFGLLVRQFGKFARVNSRITGLSEAHMNFRNNLLYTRGG